MATRHRNEATSRRKLPDVVISIVRDNRRRCRILVGRRTAATEHGAGGKERNVVGEEEEEVDAGRSCEVWHKQFGGGSPRCRWLGETSRLINSK